MKYIYILDIQNGNCEINVIYDDKDPEEWMVNKGYDLDTIQWMVTEQLNLYVNV